MSEHKAKHAIGAPKRTVVDFDLLRKVAGSNLRDLGGYPTRDGARVRQGRVYRSAHLAELPDLSPLRSLKLHTLVTLQSRAEVSVLGPPHPDVLRAVRWEHIPIGDRWFEENAPPPVTREPNTGHLVLVVDFADAWRAFFSLLGQPDIYPLLFHCSAGRDRTGVGAAMLLEVLGVNREWIVADFKDSNRVFPQMPLVAQQLAPLFEAIDRAGGIGAFMRDVIGVGPERLDVIRESLLER